ncbi:ABC transporter ATP-binding protein [Lactobacillus helveticus]|uniref:ABC transporter ATP-binding protein n=1 Tax=Lactobacillus helveticus TaxID=1587 RepID=UPI00156219A8|nr:ABC transporter ATP-binding protein [Lactobacillus helveticus]NRN76843.1 Carnitine transport ATP-binding protein OpuCA [Lactobacillus helveticus]NRO10744.1 Carnitine transport ATP-binding protein OpuCA [Lactobacillus helveticus]NRO66766.1 Carnitine transport ATP-binding protein OpuCA [Lactobacillus helveticus]
MTKEIIKFEHVAKKYSKNTIIPDLSFSIDEGEFSTVLGSSGSGKTTTLKMINGLEKPTSGEVIVNNQNLKNCNIVEVHRHIGYVVQSIGLFPHMTIAQNIAVTPKLLGWSQEKIDQRAIDLLNLVGLNDEEYSNRYPAQLSGGQQQRVGVARALSTNPPIMLFDEPFSALDAITRQNLQKKLKRIHERLQDKTFFFVTHDINEALFLGNRVMVMNQGRIEQFATPSEVVNHPASSYGKELIGTVRENQALWEELK